MKNRIVSLCCLLLSFIGAKAENVVSLSSASGHQGDEVTIEVGLTLTDAVTAAEVIIPIDKQLTYVEGSAELNSERADGHLLSAATVDGNLRLYVYSLSLNSLKGSEGTLATFRLKLKKEPADYNLTPQVVLSNAAGASLDVSTEAGTVTLLSPKLKVLTTKLDYGHIPIRNSYTQRLDLQNVGNEPLEVTEVAFSAAEFSSDEGNFTIQPGEVRSLTITYAPTVRGAIEERVIIRSNAMNGEQQAALVADPFSVNELHVEGASGISDTEVEIALRVNNMEPLVGMQCSFALPDALKYVEGSFTASERAATHTATSSVVNGKLTIILYSASNQVFTGDDGVIGTFRLRLSGNSGWYELNPEGVVLSNMTVENMTSATEGAGVTIQSPSLGCNEELPFGGIPVTAPSIVKYNVTNHGEVPLTISKVNFLAEGYAVKTALPLVVEPWQNADLEVEYTPTEEGEFATTMILYTNDPTNRTKAVKVSGTVYEPNRITVVGENQEDGTYDFTFSLENYTDVVALQMDIQWLPGMVTSTDALKATSRLASHSHTVADMGNGLYRIVLFSMSNKTISGNTGEIFTLTYTPREGTNCRDTKLQVNNVVLSNPGGTDYASENAVTAQATFTGFTLLYVLEGEVKDKQFVRIGTPLSYPEIEEREGYTFAWSESLETMPARDVTVEGSYTLNSYTLLYNVDGVEYKKYELPYGSTIPTEAEPTKEGYTFSGWKDVPEVMPANDVTVEGTFTPNRYKVTYIVDGEAYATDSVTYGERIPQQAYPTKEGYNFSGWGEIPEVMPANDVTLSGEFTVNKDLKYSLIYLVDGEEYLRTTLSFQDVITLEPAPTKEGHTFSGWSEVPETMPLHDVTVTGSFTANSYQLTYVIDGTPFKTVTIEYGTAITVPEVEEKEGYTFSGWKDVPETMPAKDVTVEGTFTANRYKVTYIVDGEEYATDSVTYGERIPLQAYPTKEGYNFSGWGEMPETMPAYDLEITGYFEVDGINAVISNKVVDVIYNLQGVLMKEEKENLPAGIYIQNGKKFIVK